MEHFHAHDPDQTQRLGNAGRHVLRLTRKVRHDAGRSQRHIQDTIAVPVLDRIETPHGSVQTTDHHHAELTLEIDHLLRNERIGQILQGCEGLGIGHPELSLAVVTKAGRLENERKTERLKPCQILGAIDGPPGARLTPISDRRVFSAIRS